ncbi:MAG TPA: coenzyme F420-0:L-glutamate ligase, partial [bacterium]|nr:coenzyme F420-0:L-glutamate ligase [bacterium]
MRLRTLAAWAPEGCPHIGPGMDLSRVIVDLLRRNRLTPENLDVFVVAHKVVSKAEGSVVNLDEVTPTPRGRALADESGKDPRLCQVILNESRAI